MNLNITTKNGYKIEEISDTSIKVTRPSDDKPSIITTVESILDEFLIWNDKTKGFAEEAIEYAIENGFDS